MDHVWFWLLMLIGFWEVRGALSKCLFFLKLQTWLGVNVNMLTQLMCMELCFLPVIYKVKS